MMLSSSSRPPLFAKRFASNSNGENRYGCAHGNAACGIETVRTSTSRKSLLQQCFFSKDKYLLQKYLLLLFSLLEQIHRGARLMNNLAFRTYVFVLRRFDYRHAHLVQVFRLTPLNKRGWTTSFIYFYKLCDVKGLNSMVLADCEPLTFTSCLGTLKVIRYVTLTPPLRCECHGLNRGDLLLPFALRLSKLYQRFRSPRFRRST